MNDMSSVIIAKSDQLNSDDLIAGPITIEVERVTIKSGTEQPVAIHYKGDNGKPYKSCKSMSRVLVHCWGADASKYVGKSMTLYRDPKVTWAGMEVGGIRISHISHIAAKQTIALTATRGNKKLFTVMPLDTASAPVKTQEKKKTVAEWMLSFQAELDEAANASGIEALVAREDFVKMLSFLQGDNLTRLNAMIAAAKSRVTPAENVAEENKGEF